jgi:hypothetical protein
MDELKRGTREWYIEVTNMSDLLHKWKDHPDDDVIQAALQESMEKLGLISDI